MELTKIRTISSNAVRGFVEAGGTLKYVPDNGGPKGRIWYLFCIDPRDGSEIPVVIGRTGEHKAFKTSDAVIAFHLTLFPETTELSIPLR